MMLKSSLAREGPLFGEQQRVGVFECIAGCLAAVLETVCVGMQTLELRSKDVGWMLENPSSKHY